MTRDDYIGLFPFVGFGLWWVLFPSSVIKFYAWLHRKEKSSLMTWLDRYYRTPKPLTVRVLGALWVAIVIAIMATR